MLERSGNDNCRSMASHCAIHHPETKQHQPLVLQLFSTSEGEELLPSVWHLPRPDITDFSQIPDEVCARAVAIIVSHLGKIDAALLDRCNKLRVVSRTGVGVDNIDVEYASELGICVCNVPDYGIEEVADTALAHILCLFRQTTFLYEGLRRGDPQDTPDQLLAAAKSVHRIRGRTLGLIGLGNIGLAVANRAKVFGFKVIFYDPFVRPGLEKAVGGLERFDSVEEVVQQSDCVSLHCSVTKENRHMINEKILRLFKKEAFLVNVARGALVDENALAKALKEGWIAGAAIDVYEDEPFAFKGSVFEDVPNLICTPHSAWYSSESRKDLFAGSVKAARYALTASDTTRIRNCVNREKLSMESCRARWED